MKNELCRIEQIGPESGPTRPCVKPVSLPGVKLVSLPHVSVL